MTKEAEEGEDKKKISWKYFTYWLYLFRIAEIPLAFYCINIHHQFREQVLLHIFLFIMKQFSISTL